MSQQTQTAPIKVGFAFVVGEEGPMLELKKQLSALRRNNKIEFVQAFEASMLFVIISPKLLDDDHWMAWLHSMYTSNTMRLLPVAYAPCDVDNTWLGNLQPIGQFLWIKHEKDKDSLYAAIAASLRQIVDPDKQRRRF